MHSDDGMLYSPDKINKGTVAYSRSYLDSGNLDLWSVVWSSKATDSRN